MEIGLQHFNRRNLEPILRGQQELGAHTDVVEFQQSKISTFRWTHHGTRPMGFSFINQCIGCHHLQTLTPSVKKDHTRILMKCSFCERITTYNFPQGWNWANNPPVKGDERGAWIVRVEALGDKDVMDMT